jgi:hypothetical protein
MTATAMSGTGWACDVPSRTCTRSDALGNGSSYPNITLTVDVALGASSPLDNQATVSGGGETNLGNDTAHDSTVVIVVVPARVFVSVTGNDANDCSNIATPCLTLGGAIAQVAAGGEVIVRSSGQYDGPTIGKSVTINAAPIFVVYINSGITVAAGPSDVVVIKGLTLTAATPGSGTGITFTSGGSLRVEGCVVTRWATGIAGNAAGELTIRDTIVRDTTSGVTISNGAAVLDRARLERNGTGLFVSSSSAAVRRSVVSASASDGVRADLGGVVEVADTVLTGNGQGATAGPGTATIRLSGCAVTENTIGLLQTGSGVLLSLVDNTVEGNGTNVSGTLGTYTSK